MQPADHVHANVVQAMHEIGVDLSREKPRMLTNDMVERAQRVITMGCAVDSNACLAVFLKNVEDWRLPDPSGRSMEEVRAIRDQVEEKVIRLIAELRLESVK